MIFLGDLTVDEFAKRTGFNISEEDKATLNKYKCDKATIDYKENQLHIFDIPFAIEISMPIYKEIFSMLNKYNDISSTKEPLRVIEVKETEQQARQRITKEKEKAALEEMKNDVDKIWQVQYYLLVPVTSNCKEYYYSCFINVYIKGFYNIPESVDGTGFISKDEEGLRGHFNLAKTNEFFIDSEYNFVVGYRLCNLSGNSMRKYDEYTFEETHFNIKECINNYKTITGNSSKYIFYDK